MNADGQQKNHLWNIARKAALLLSKAVAVLFGVLCLAILGVYFYISWDLPAADVLKSTEGLRSLFLDDYQQAQQVVLIPLREMPPYVVNAIIAANDSERNNIGGKHFFAGGKFTYGLIHKLLYPRSQSRMHIESPVMLLNIELGLNREEIISAWLAITYFGQGTYGISAASQKYFNKPLGELTICEAALLAYIPQLPTHNPVNKPQEAQKRQQLTLEKMVELGLASEADVAACGPGV